MEGPGVGPDRVVREGEVGQDEVEPELHQGPEARPDALDLPGSPQDEGREGGEEPGEQALAERGQEMPGEEVLSNGGAREGADRLAGRVMTVCAVEMMVCAVEIAQAPQPFVWV